MRKMLVVPFLFLSPLFQSVTYADTPAVSSPVNGESVSMTRLGKTPIILREALFRYGNLNIGLYKAVQDPYRQIFCHDPAWWVEQRESVHPYLPSCALEVYVSEKDATRVVHFGLWTSTEELRERCLDFLREERPEFFHDEKGNPVKTEVHCFDVQHVVLHVLDRLTGELLGVGESAPHQRGEDRIKVLAHFKPDKFDRFVELANQGNVAFQPIYSFEGRKVENVEVREEWNADVVKEVEHFINSKRLVEGGPIFQDLANELVAQMKLSVVRNIYTENAKLLPAFLPADNVFSAFLTFAQQDKAETDPIWKEQISSYLARELERFSEVTGIQTTSAYGIEDEDFDIKRHTVYKRKGKQRSAGVKTGGSYNTGAYGEYSGEGAYSGTDTRGSGTVDQSEQISRYLEMLRRSKGIELRKIKDTEVYRPHFVQLYELNTDHKDFKFSSVSRGAVVTDSDHGYFWDSNVPVDRAFPEVFKLRYARRLR